MLLKMNVLLRPVEDTRTTCLSTIRRKGRGSEPNVSDLNCQAALEHIGPEVHHFCLQTKTH